MFLSFRENLIFSSLSILEPLKREALKYSTFEEYEKAFVVQIKRGLYWHVTKDSNFKIDLSTGPRDMSSLGTGQISAGKLMVTSHLEPWAEHYEGSRVYAAQIDLSNLNPKEYWQVNRGFGNEIFVDNASVAKVVRVLPINEALSIDASFHDSLPQSKEELKEFWDEIHNLSKVAHIRLSKLDYNFLKFELEDLFKEGHITFESLKNYFILDVISKNESLDLGAKNIIDGELYKVGNEIKEMILDEYLKWHKRHTSPENLLGWDEWSDDKEATVAFPFVEEGRNVWRREREPYEIWIWQLIEPRKRKLIKQLEEYFGEDLSSLNDYDFEGEWKELTETLRIQIVKFLSPYIFKEWKNIWGEDLIEPTKSVLKAIKYLKRASPQELPGAISLSLQVQHVSGKMVEYLNLTTDELNELSNINESEIKEVEKKLFKPDYSEEKPTFSLKD